MEELVAYRLELLSALSGVVNEFSKIGAAIPSNAWHLPFGQAAHTPHYTLAHLREVEKQEFGFQLRRFQDEDTPLLPLFDDTAWMASHYEPGESAQVILEEFSDLRKLEVNWLRDLSPEGWSRTARHPKWGVHTLQWWVELQLDYSHQHLGELAAIPAM